VKIFCFFVIVSNWLLYAIWKFFALKLHNNRI